MSEQTREIVLQVEGLAKSYGGRQIVNGLSFDVARGEVVGLLGPNGAGKTTAFYLTMGLIRPDKGRVLFQKRDITRLPIHKRAKLGMGYLAQEPSVFRTLTVRENITCILQTLKMPKQQQKRRLEELLCELRLEKLADKKALSLSGGERRRLEVTRALVTSPTFLLLDEPFANIDPIAVQDVKEMIRLLAAKNISVLITDHNAREIFSIVDRSYLVCDGKVMLSGSVETLIKSPEARRWYLGDEFKL